MCLPVWNRNVLMVLSVVLLNPYTWVTWFQVLAPEIITPTFLSSYLILSLESILQLVLISNFKAYVNTFCIHLTSEHSSCSKYNNKIKYNSWITHG